MVLSPHTSRHDSGVVSRRRHHAEHLSRGRFYRHDAAYFAFKQSLAECLKLYVDAQSDVFSSHGPTVVTPVLVLALYSSTGVAQQNLHAFLSSQLLFVILFYTEFAYIVARLVVVVVLNVAWRHFGDIAEHMRRIRVLVLPYASPLDIEARKAEYLLLEYAEFFV